MTIIFPIFSDGAIYNVQPIYKEELSTRFYGIFYVATVQKKQHERDQNARKLIKNVTEEAGYSAVPEGNKQQECSIFNKHDDHMMYIL